jgi:predicted extracellular nuclease
VFNGVSQVLDHILVSSGVGEVEYEVVHINAENADQVSGHDPQVVRLQP